MIQQEKFDFLLSDVLKEQGEYDLAVENINKYLEIKPDDNSAKESLASCEKAVEWKNNPTKHLIPMVTSS